MSERRDILADMTLEQICRQQYDEIEKKNIQLWDFEEENAILHQKVAELQEVIVQREARIHDLEVWCTKLQARLDEKEDNCDILIRIARKIKRLLFRK